MIEKLEVDQSSAQEQSPALDAHEQATTKKKTTMPPFSDNKNELYIGGASEYGGKAKYGRLLFFNERLAEMQQSENATVQENLAVVLNPTLDDRTREEAMLTIIQIMYPEALEDTLVYTGRNQAKEE